MGTEIEKHEVSAGDCESLVAGEISTPLQDAIDEIANHEALPSLMEKLADCQHPKWLRLLHALVQQLTDKDDCSCGIGHHIFCLAQENAALRSKINEMTAALLETQQLLKDGEGGVIDGVVWSNSRGNTTLWEVIDEVLQEK